jgi:hypothetical protein
MASTYSVRGVTVATAASADNAICQLWNASTTKKIKVVEIGIFKTAAGTSGDSLYVARTSARGTSAANATPDIDNHWDHELAPASGAILDTDFSADPTILTPGLMGWAAANVAASGMIWPCPRGIWVGQSDGLALVQRAATAWPVSEVYFIWEE